MTSSPSAVSLAIRGGLLLAMSAGLASAESEGTILGRVADPSGRPVPKALIILRNSATLVDRTASTNDEGLFELPALPVGSYRLHVRALGFRLYTVEAITVEVARTVDLDVRLEIGDVSEEITVRSQAALVDLGTTTVGHVMDGRTVQDMPLNGRYFLDLAVLSPGSVTAPQNGFNSVPTRGLGAFSINTAGNRDSTTNYVINGITLNNLLYGSIIYQPSISSVQEFKIDNSTLSAEYGQSSGSIVNLATRSGSGEYHGELFEFLRNNALDARNFFTLTSSKTLPFKRNQFGGNLGGPIIKGKTFFFAYYEGMRQSQSVDLNSLVFSDAQRQSAAGTAVAKLMPLIPRSNFTDSAGTPRFVGSAPAPVDGDQSGTDLNHIFNARDSLHGFYSIYRTIAVEPGGRGNNIPGFGYVSRALRQFFSLNETHIFGQHINEARFGVIRQSSSTRPNTQLNPTDFGIRDGITEPVGLPQINIAGGALNFGGPSAYPSGRGDTTFVFNDTITCSCGRHALKVGGEYRQYLDNIFRLGSGAFNFASVSAFLADTANSFSVTLGSQSGSIAQAAFGFFIQDSYKWHSNLSLELGLRYEWNKTPTERFGRFIVFDPSTASLVRLGQKRSDVYRQNDRNFEPRVGLAWDPFKDRKTSLRAAYAIFVDQPITNVVVGTTGNPPLANPLTFTGLVSLESAIDLATAVGLAPMSVDRGFRNASVQSWNLNLQRELSPGLAVLVGYFGSKGDHLTLARNINQPIGGIRPFPVISPSSQILPGSPVANISQMEGTGNSSYNALWLSANKRLARGLEINASYTWSKSLDYNSLSNQGVVVQNSYDLRGDRGLSDYDARQRFVVNAIYELPFRGSRLSEGWQLAAIGQAQSGNPVNIVTTNSAVTGVANTLRPNVTGPIAIIGSVDRWFDITGLAPVSGFGNLGRNSVIGPGFNNMDLSLMKNTRLGERMRVQFRAEFFDLFNHANFGQPGNVVGSPSFSRITNTRFPTGESGSSRQVQLGIKLMF
jgi:hypothetical protein